MQFLINGVAKLASRNSQLEGEGAKLIWKTGPGNLKILTGSGLNEYSSTKTE